MLNLESDNIFICLTVYTVQCMYSTKRRIFLCGERVLRRLKIHIVGKCIKILLYSTVCTDLKNFSFNYFGLGVFNSKLYLFVLCIWVYSNLNKKINTIFPTWILIFCFSSIFSLFQSVKLTRVLYNSGPGILAGCMYSILICVYLYKKKCAKGFMNKIS